MAGYKINSNKSVAFLYLNDKWTEKENMKTKPFTVVKNNIKYLGVTLNIHEKDLYDKSIKSRKKETFFFASGKGLFQNKTHFLMT